MMRVGVVLVSVIAGVAAGGLVFKVVGEERVGGEVKAFATRLGFKGGGASNTAAFDLLEQIAPGTKDNFQSAVITTVVVSLIVATATAVALREITS